MNSAEVKEQANCYWGQDKKLDAYKKLWELDFSDFESYFNKKSANKKFPATDFFFQNFVTTVSPDWLNHDDAIRLIQNYFEKSFTYCADFEQFLLHNYPTLYVKAVTQSSGFMLKRRLEELNSLSYIPEAVALELPKWKYWNDKVNRLWGAITKGLETHLEQPQKLIMQLCATHESCIYGSQNTRDRQFYTDALSLLVAYVQTSSKDLSIATDFNELYGYFIEEVCSQKLSNVFQQTREFKEVQSHLYRYQYEPGYEMDYKIGKEPRFRESVKFNKQWEPDGLRYTLNEKLYYNYGYEIFDEAVSSGEIKPLRKNDRDALRSANSRCIGITKAVNDLGIKDADLKKGSMHLSSLIAVLENLGSNKLERIERKLDAQKKKRISNYREALISLLYIDKKLNDPILLIDRATLENQMLSYIYTTQDIQTKRKQAAKLIKDYTFNWQAKETFDPFKMPLSLFQRPFINVGGMIVSPVGVISSFAGLYPLSESILKNYRPKDGRAIEKILKNYLSTNSRWCCTLPENENNEGDIDVQLEDGEHIVLMQLKRTTQKTDMRELHSQAPQDRKAIKQLMEAKQSLVQNGETRSIHLWYVTTAFERVGTVQKEVRRVSYQELLHSHKLLAQENLSFNSVAHLVEYVENDRFITLAKQYLQEDHKI
ncbi:MAG: hypothetical protein WBA16_01320 [Nonlabens sp.]